MIGPGTGVRVYLACGVTDMRKGIAGLAALAQDVLRQKLTGGAVFAFRGRKGDRLKLLYWDGQRFCLYYKVLQRGRFPWPNTASGAARLTCAQLAMLWEGIDWRRPDWGAPPARVGQFICLKPCFYGIFYCRMITSGMPSDAAIMPEDPALLKAMIAALQAENARISATIRAHDQLIQTPRLRIAKLKKQAFGKSSEKVERELELALEDLLIAAAESVTAPTDEDAVDDATAVANGDTYERRPRRRPRVSDATPRERRELDPGTCCPDCGGDLRLVGEDVSDILDLVAAQLKVLQIARLKKSCRRCEKMVQEPAPSRPIPGSMASAALLAYVLVSKYDDHLPLYRQAEIFTRMGADIPDSTLVDWCGRAMKVLQPLIERIEADVMASDVLHADDTPIRVLDKSLRDRGWARA